MLLLLFFIFCFLLGASIVATIRDFYTKDREKEFCAEDENNELRELKKLGYSSYGENPIRTSYYMPHSEIGINPLEERVKELEKEVERAKWDSFVNPLIIWDIMSHKH